MAKIVFLDIYKKSTYRQSKDTNGGFGTENDFGYGLIPFILNRVAKISTFWPQINTLNFISELINQKHNVTYTNLLEDIKNDVDYVFIPTSIINCNHEIEAIRNIRNYYKKIKIFVFGPFAEQYKQEYMLAGASVIIGEAEFIGVDFNLKTQVLSELHKNKIINVKNTDPNLLSLPLWTSTNIPKTKNFIFSGSFSKSVPIIASRGCPYSCYEYCTYPLAQGRKVRTVDPKKLITDMNYIYKNTGTRNFIFRDPVFTINKKYSNHILENLASLNKKYSFTIETHLNNINANLAIMLNDANVKTVKFGIESYSKDVMKNVHRYSIKHQEELDRINLLHKNKIKTHAMYILCQPEDTYESILKTINYSIKLNTNLAQYSLFTPYPGTPYFERNRDMIIEKNYERFSQFNLVFKHKKFSNEDAKKMLGLAYGRFYKNKIFNKWL